MTGTSFGQALGRLIRRKRKAAGLTQLQLSEDAYETSSKVRRISELESGQVHNPHPATIDPLIVALKISDDELAACAAHAGVASEPNDLDDAYRNARNLIEALAKQFEHDNPDATLGELDDFLRAKSREWRDLRQKIQALQSDDVKIDDAKRRAEVALGHGDFGLVDEYLQKAEDYHQEINTIEAVKKQSEIRIARGDALLLKGDKEGAINAFEKAAGYFAPFDEALQVSTLDMIAWRIYEISLRTLPGNFDVAADILRRKLTLGPVNNDALERVKTAYRLSLVLRNLADRTKSDSSHAVIEEAAAFARAAMSGADRLGEPHRQVSSAVSLANCLMALGKQSEAMDPISEAIEILENAKNVCSKSDDASQLLQHVANSLGSSLLYLANLKPDELLFEKAMHNFKLAVSASEENFDFEVWGGAKANVARLLRREASLLPDGSEESIFLRIRAISEYQAALETYPETVFSARFAEIQFEIAGLFFHHAQHCDGHLAELYFMRSINAYAAAGSIHDRETDPRRWADINLYSGSVFANHAEIYEHSRENDINQAVAHFCEARDVYLELGVLDYAGMCNDAISHIESLR